MVSSPGHFRGRRDVQLLNLLLVSTLEWFDRPSALFNSFHALSIAGPCSNCEVIECSKWSRNPKQIDGVSLCDLPRSIIRASEVVEPESCRAGGCSCKCSLGGCRRDGSYYHTAVSTILNYDPFYQVCLYDHELTTILEMWAGASWSKMVISWMPLNLEQ